MNIFEVNKLRPATNYLLKFEYPDGTSEFHLFETKDINTESGQGIITDYAAEDHGDY
jgi:hypothetical protein